MKSSVVPQRPSQLRDRWWWWWRWWTAQVHQRMNKHCFKWPMKYSTRSGWSTGHQTTGPKLALSQFWTHHCPQQTQNNKAKTVRNHNISQYLHFTHWQLHPSEVFYLCENVYLIHYLSWVTGVIIVEIFRATTNMQQNNLSLVHLQHKNVWSLLYCFWSLCARIAFCLLE